jgi:hypothetical protein
MSGGKPIGVKLAAGNIEADLEVALYAGPDFITIDGSHLSLPTIPPINPQSQSPKIRASNNPPAPRPE